MKRIGQMMCFLLPVIIVSSCTKQDSSPTDAVAGTWTFTAQVFQSFSPSTVSSPTTVYNSSSPADSVRIIFDGSGNYAFMNYQLPVDIGKYTIIRDSLLIIKPDTSGFVKFNYTVPSNFSIIGSGSSTPYANFHFTSDTIVFQKTAGYLITFGSTWKEKSSTPVAPGTDSMVLNKNYTTFTLQ